MTDHEKREPVLTTLTKLLDSVTKARVTASCQTARDAAGGVRTKGSIVLPLGACTLGIALLWLLGDQELLSYVFNLLTIFASEDK